MQTFCRNGSPPLSLSCPEDWWLNTLEKIAQVIPKDFKNLAMQILGINLHHAMLDAFHRLPLFNLPVLQMKAAAGPPAFWPFPFGAGVFQELGCALPTPVFYGSPLLLKAIPREL